jgi:hypothetical protein
VLRQLLLLLLVEVEAVHDYVLAVAQVLSM